MLAIDEKEYLNNIINTYNETFAVAMEIGYVTKETIKPMLQKAFRQGTGLSVDTAYVTKDTVEKILTKAGRMCSSVKTQLNI